LFEGDEDMKSESVIDNFGIMDFDKISSLKADVSEKALKYDNVFVKERIDSRIERDKQKEVKVKKKAGMLGGLFGGFNLKKSLFSLFSSGDN
jgi:hypothetical protein